MASAAPSSPTEVVFGTRFAAFMIDAVALFSAQWIAVIVLSRQLQAVGMTRTYECSVGADTVCEGPSTALWALLFTLVVASTYGYHAWFEGNRGATPGKQMVGIEVVDAADGGRIGVARGIVRAVVRQAPWLWAFLQLDVSPISIGGPPIVFFGLLGLSLLPLFLAAFSPAHAPHDLAANSAVRTVVPKSATPETRSSASPSTAFTSASTPQEP